MSVSWRESGGIVVSVLARALRWLLVPISAAAVVAGTIIAGRWAVAIAAGRCAPQNMVGGACVEPWHTSVVETVVYTGVVLAAAGIVVLPAAIAPEFKRTTGAVTFVLGVGGLLAVHVAASNLMGWSELMLPLLLAAATGAAALWWAFSWRVSNDS